jgi:adenine/guanine/hypoxanthine permease
MEWLFHEKMDGTRVRTEVRAGIATFLTMAYIIIVNPAILEEAGMPRDGALLATVLVAACGSILMGLLANLPFAIAPGMGINAFFTYGIVIGMGVRWQTALGAVFVSGVVFLLLSIFRIRERIVAAIPPPVRFGVAAGIGLFLAFIGLQKVGFVVGDPVTIVRFGGMNVQRIVFVVGLVGTGWLVIRRCRGALIWGIAGTSLLALTASRIAETWGDAPFAVMPDRWVALPSTAVLFELDIVGALTWGMLLPIFALTFTDLFDSLSTFVGVSEVGGFIEPDTGQPKNVAQALLVDAIASMMSGLFGTSSGTTYIESAAGVEEGGRTGLTAIVTGLLFLPFAFFSPLLSFVPEVATAPVLVLIGVFMIGPIRKVPWDDFESAIPAFLSLILIPLTYSITQGIVWGFLSHTAIKVLQGEFRQISLTLWLINLCAVASLVLGH